MSLSVSMLTRLALAGGLAALVAGCALPPDRLEGDAPPPVVEGFELDRYLGRWFEIARYDNRFERGCDGVTATYATRPGDEITVINTCRQGGLDGEVEAIEGRARQVDGAKLEVSFFGPFWGDYWVIELDEAYQWSVVSEPQGRFLWILSREPQMDEAVLNARLERLRALGFDTDALVYPQQWQSAEAAPVDSERAQ
ncbi:MAG: lipocalin family protein [Pseudomonadota bacterium]